MKFEDWDDIDALLARDYNDYTTDIPSRRLYRAATALRAYTALFDDEVICHSIADLIADLLHLADAVPDDNCLDVLKSATTNHTFEVNWDRDRRAKGLN